MASELRKLHACVAYSIRMAKRSHAVEAGPHLWSALHCLTADRMQRRVLSLSHVLGIPDQVESTAPQTTPPQASAHDRQLQSLRRLGLCEGREIGCQTMCKIYTEEECKGISEQLMSKILEDTMASMQSLVTRLNALEGRQTTCKTAPGSEIVTSTVLGVPVPIASAGCAGSSSANCKPASIDSLDDRDVAKRVEVDASHSDAAETLEVLKERHRARRLALKEQRRQDRKDRQNS